MRSGIWIRVLAGVLSLGCQRWHRSGSGRPAAGASLDVRGRVVSVTSSRESQFYVTVKIELTNVGGRAATVSGYEIAWPGGRQSVEGLSLTLAAGQNIIRTLRVSPASGALDSLTAEQARLTWR